MQWCGIRGSRISLFFVFFSIRVLERFLRFLGHEMVTEIDQNGEKALKRGVRRACVFFNVFGHVFYGFGDPQTLDFDQLSYGFEVFLVCRRSPLEVDSASQKSSKIHLKSHKSRERTFRGRLEKDMCFKSFLLLKKSPERPPFWLPKSISKAYKRGYLFERLRESFWDLGVSVFGCLNS